MLNSTVELIALWASSRPSLLAFCFSHLIIAVLLLLGGRGECTPAAAEAETLGSIRAQGGKRRGRGQERPTGAVSVVVEHRHPCAPDVDGRVAEADTDAAVQLEVSEKSSGAEGGPAAAADDDTVQEKCGDDEEEDELMMRAEEFIQRMNRIWRTENVRLC